MMAVQADWKDAWPGQKPETGMHLHLGEHVREGGLPGCHDAALGCLHLWDARVIHSLQRKAPSEPVNGQ